MPSLDDNDQISSPGRDKIDHDDEGDIMNEETSHVDDNDEDDGDLDVDEDDDNNNTENLSPSKEKPNQHESNVESEPTTDAALLRFADSIKTDEDRQNDPVILAQMELINSSTPTTDLEIALSDAFKRKQYHLTRLTAEIIKLKNFISKRKQTYKRKRKDDGAPTRALSAYNIFIQERFALLAKENEKALRSDSEDATIQRVPPAHLVAATGNVWKTLPLEEKKKYEERAKGDRKRYEEQMAEYQAPDKQVNRKRNKTGYNMFFSSHVLRLKQTESGVPSERGSVARLVGTAWKLLAPEEKAYYEREADKHNGMNPVKDGEEDDDEEEMKRQHMEYQMQVAAHSEMHMHAVPPPIHAAMQHPQHDPRHQHHPYYPPAHMYGPPPPPPYGHYDYSQHHQRHPARAQGYHQQGYPPPPSRHPYEG